MDVSPLLVELFSRVPPVARSAVDGLGPDQLIVSPAPGANTIGWLVWHLARVQDQHVAELIGTEQLWVDGPWASRLGLVADPTNTGYGHSVEEMSSVRPDGADVLIDYLDTVDRQTQTMLADLVPADLDRIVDRRFDPPVTLGVRLVSVADDCLQHAGQAAYARGVLGL